MASWEDTVMMPEVIRRKRKELFPHGHKDCYECERFIRNAQAEISFKAGREEEKKEMNLQTTSLAELLLTHRKAGIREVVGWIDKTFAKTITIDQMMATNTWQAKLKDRGIE